MITEDYVSFEVAKLLKENGFDESTIFVYYDFLPSSLCFSNKMCRKGVINLFYYNETSQVNSKFNNSMSIPKYISGEVYSAPTLQMAMKWLREVHHIHINLDIHWLDFANSKGWMYVIETILENGVEFVDCKGDDNDKTFYLTYEQACEAAIKYCLENLI